jgi:hypothetical protein
VPNEIALVAGEVLQNLRSALDHLAYQLYLKAGVRLEWEDMYVFPFTRTKGRTTTIRLGVRAE